jgi:ribonucleoside-triphosphate reductase
MFIYNLNMAYAARGSQVPFTSINLEFTVPEFLQNEPAYGPKGKLVGVYGDFEEETRALQRAFTETLLNGDSDGKPHLFPNTIYAIRDKVLKDEFEEELICYRIIGEIWLITWVAVPPLMMIGLEIGQRTVYVLVI